MRKLRIVARTSGRDKDKIEISQYILEKKNNFRVCTSCGGPVILSTLVKPPKPSDLEIYVGDYILYVSIYQARFIDRIDINMIPRFSDYI